MQVLISNSYHIYSIVYKLIFYGAQILILETNFN